MFGILDKILGNINKSIAVFGISAGVALAFINVVARYGFNSSITWASELTNYFFIWSTFFGAAYCFKKDAHISITILLERLPSPLVKVLMIISHVIVIIYLLAVSYYGYKYLLLEIDLGEVSINLIIPKLSWLGMKDSWAVPMWIPYSVIPLAFLSGAIQVFEKLIEIIKTPANLARKESEAEMIISKMQEGEDKNKIKKMEKTLVENETFDKIERVEDGLKKIERQLESLIDEEFKSVSEEKKEKAIKNIEINLNKINTKINNKIKELKEGIK